VDYVTVSIGVASNVDHTDIESMIRAADEHLYQAKAAGRNQIGA
jgi:diguanylate cyclase (GGDEF)-like protein